MRKLIILLVFAVACQVENMELTTFILVRHAEKADDGTKDPGLTEEGVQRSENLLSLLNSTDITAIYSTNYKRTRLTVEPLADSKSLTIQTYDWKDPEAMIQKMIADYPGGTVVISGHSNTTPVLANILLGSDLFQQFDDADYSNLLIITASETGSGKLVHLSY